MANLLPILLIGGGAFALTRSKKKRRKKGYDLPPPPEDGEIEKKSTVKPIPEPTPSPTPEPAPEPVPEPGPGPEPTPTPDEKRPTGPSGVGTCVQYVYNRVAEPLDPEIGKVLSVQAASMFADPMWDFYIRQNVQIKLYNQLASRFSKMRQGQERPTVSSVVLRQELEKINSGCNWDGTIESWSKPEQLVWDDAKRIMWLAMEMTGFRDPLSPSLMKTGNRLVVTRESLGMPDPGIPEAGLSLGQRVEFLGTDESLDNVEHLMGQVTRLTGPNGEKNLFELTLVGDFQGRDVSPKLSEKHGFKFFKGTQKGSNAFFRRNSPTGIYRIFGKGVA